MIVREIALRGFRNHGSARFELGSGVNIICGPNGRGKTNLLEAIYMLSGVRSWRTGQRRELIGWESGLARIEAVVSARGRDYEIILTLPRAGAMSATVNGVKVSRQNPLSDIFRGVLFSPEDLMLVKGPPTLRREFIDGALSQLRPRYAAMLGRYHKVLLSKGRLLRQAQENHKLLNLLPEYDAQLVEYGASLIGYRAEFCALLARGAGQVQQEISGGREALEVVYKTVSTVERPDAEIETVRAWLREHLARHSEAEQAAGACLSGVHRDDLLISIGGQPARAYASQGQARSAALALRFAQREIFMEDLGEHPVLLLDDVLSELDEGRRAYVCRGLGEGQTILTCCTPEQGFEGAAKRIEI